MLANLFGKATTELILFVHHLISPGTQQLPVQHMVAAAGDNKHFGGDVADEVNQVTYRCVVGHCDNDRLSFMNAGMFENLTLGRIAKKRP